VNYGEVLGDKSAMYIRCPYTEVTWLYSDYSIWEYLYCVCFNLYCGCL